MDPLTAFLQCLQAGFLFGTELVKFFQTDQGRQLVAQSIEDRKNWDAFWAPVLGGLTSIREDFLLQIKGLK